MFIFERDQRKWTKLNPKTVFVQKSDDGSMQVLVVDEDGSRHEYGAADSKASEIRKRLAELGIETSEHEIGQVAFVPMKPGVSFI